ncbi:hypothetical protein CEXT_712461 [Caerostris extrusa]|uniref:Uncharacterized protein n=1 Tax=Caerostris extrusa TaxID=172846 RepID=A0AAV4U4E9_CAEEX|nr:hypothetical protein CEXT_712461 [Caerostris extrusa]
MRNASEAFSKMTNGQNPISILVVMTSTLPLDRTASKQKKEKRSKLQVMITTAFNHTVCGNTSPHTPLKVPEATSFTFFCGLSKILINMHIGNDKYDKYRFMATFVYLGIRCLAFAFIAKNC